MRFELGEIGCLTPIFIGVTSMIGIRDVGRFHPHPNLLPREKGLVLSVVLPVPDQYPINILSWFEHSFEAVFDAFVEGDEGAD